MPCCNAGVTLRRSKRGIQHFVHKVIGNCTSAPETEHHLRLKEIAVEVARRYGWTVETEVRGVTPDGEEWIADVLARKNNAKVAIEIQWSPQTPEETLRRQERYRKSGVRCLWLFRHAGFPIAAELPAVQVSAVDDGYATRLSDISMPLQTFLDAAFDGRLKFGLPSIGKAVVQIKAGDIECWKSQCKATTKIITGIDVIFGSRTYSWIVKTLDGAPPSVLHSVIENLPKNLNIGTLKKRYSNTIGDRYLSNGCYRCDSLIGQHFESEVWYSDEIISSFQIDISGDWRRMIEQEYEPEWAVYRVNELLC
ncbi:competence protein CoiA family protein [Agrobacterium sp. Azo12]|nr:competence protein CoiA family protein [Agrobacterium sp. Azo12]MDO5897887.1 competence protein CoiA family protein [Agrobacterium sp. Azo12]